MCLGKTEFVVAENPETTDDEETELEAELEDELEDEEDDTEIIRAKWMFDGCATFDEIIERLNAEIARFQQLKEEGWELVAPVDDDYGFIKQKPQPA